MTTKELLLRFLISAILNFAFIIFLVKIKHYEFPSYILGVLQMGLYIGICEYFRK